MRILHVVTLITPDGAFGGPVRVAANQLKQLASMGHEVTLVAGTRGYPTGETTIYESVNAQLFRVRNPIPGTGFAGSGSLRLLRHIRRVAPLNDVVHVHMSRDFVTLPAAAIAQHIGVPVVIQTHGMIDRSSHPLAKPLDAALTRKVLRRSSSVLYLTEVERRALLDFQPDLESTKLSRLVNGVPRATSTATLPTNPCTEYLYLARLHERKRPIHFVEALARLRDEGRVFRFSLVGPDGGQAHMVQNRIRELSLEGFGGWEGALSPDDTLDRMRRADIYVLPSVNEPFPMSVLEAMSVGVPPIVTSSCGLAPDLAARRAGLVVDESLEGLVDAMRSLGADDNLRRSISQAAQSMVKESFSMKAVAQTLLRSYTNR